MHVISDHLIYVPINGYITPLKRVLLLVKQKRKSVRERKKERERGNGENNN